MLTLLLSLPTAILCITPSPNPLNNLKPRFAVDKFPERLQQAFEYRYFTNPLLHNEVLSNGACWRGYSRGSPTSQSCPPPSSEARLPAGKSRCCNYDNGAWSYCYSFRVEWPGGPRRRGSGRHSGGKICSGWRQDLHCPPSFDDIYPLIDSVSFIYPDPNTFLQLGSGSPIHRGVDQ